MNTARPIRLAVVLSHPTQYYSPWFQWLRVHTAIEFRVFYLWKFGVTPQRDREFQESFAWDVDLLSGYDHEFVPNTAKDPGTHHFGGLRNPELVSRLAAWQPTSLLLFGYKSSAHAAAILWARRNGIPLIFRGDSHFLGRGVPGLVARTVLRTTYAQFAAFLPVGSANRDYFTALGVPESKLFFTPHAVNEQHFDPNSAKHRDAAAALRAQIGVPATDHVVLFAGKLVPAKQPRELLQAFLSCTSSDAHLIFVGEGPEKAALVASLRQVPHARVHFLPFANQSAMPAHLLLADVFALPSRGHYETWGLAVNEAMHMGVPALVSNLVGCQRDLVADGETGWVFDAASSASLQVKLDDALKAVADPAAREKFRANVRARIAGYTYAQATTGLLAALNHVAAR